MANKKALGLMIVWLMTILVVSGCVPPQNYNKYRSTRSPNQLGYKYQLGIGVPQDYKKALHFYGIGAEQGNADAQLSLADMYYYGKGTSKDYKKALYWLTKAAEQNNLLAQQKLARMYKKGQGAPVNYENAIKWYRIAAKNDPESTSEVLASIASDLEESLSSGKQKSEPPKESKVVKKPRPKKNPKQRIDDNKVLAAASGTGFIVSERGHIITNNHVINGCAKVKVYRKGRDYPSTVVATDPLNDLALLKTDLRTKSAFPLSNANANLLQDVFVAGFPFGKIISSSVKITKGIVSSVTGMGNNYSNMQIDAALQPGNSGGPVVDDKGNVVGVAVAKLSLAKVVKEWGVVPENTNFGIKSSVVRNFLESNGLVLTKPRTSFISKQKLAKNITDGTLYLSCWMTYAKIKQLKAQKVMFTNFE